MQESRAEIAEKEASFQGLTQQYQEMCAGIAGAEGGDATLTDQIASTGQQAQAAKAERKQCKNLSNQSHFPASCLHSRLVTVDLRISHLEKSISDQKKEAKKSEKDFQKTEADRAKLQAIIEDLRTRLNGLEYDPVRPMSSDYHRMWCFEGASRWVILAGRGGQTTSWYHGGGNGLRWLEAGG